MPTNAATFLARPKYARILAFGEPKSQKTWWALKAAEAGFNVLLIDGDAGASIARNITPDGLGRTTIVDAVDVAERPVFKIFMDLWSRDKHGFLWDCTAKAPALRSTPEHDFLLFDFSKLNGNDVVIIDSLKMLAWSMRYAYAIQHKIDLADAERTTWDGYGFEGNLMNFVLASMSKMSCHFIVITHSQEYDKREVPKKGAPRDQQGQVLWSKTIPVSTSANNSFGCLSYWSDILFFKRYSEALVMIDTGGSNDRPGGCRSLAPKAYRWNELPPDKILNCYEGSDLPHTAWDYIPVGSPVIDGPHLKGQALSGGMPVSASAAIHMIQLPKK